MRSALKQHYQRDGGAHFIYLIAVWFQCLDQFTFLSHGDMNGLWLLLCASVETNITEHACTKFEFINFIIWPKDLSVLLWEHNNSCLTASNTLPLKCVNLYALMASELLRVRAQERVFMHVGGWEKV